jgi:hypothetical protein
MFQVPTQAFAGSAIIVGIPDVTPIGPGKELTMRLVKTEQTEVIQKVGSYSKYSGMSYSNVACPGKDEACVASLSVVLPQSNSGRLEYEILVPESCPETMKYSTSAEICYRIVFTGISEASVPIQILSPSTKPVSEELKCVESLALVSCWCCKNGFLEVLVEGASDTFALDGLAEFSLTFKGEGAKNIDFAKVSVASNIHIQSTGTLQLVPLRDTVRSSVNEQVLTNVRPNRKYKMSMVVSDKDLVFIGYSGKIIRIEPTIRIQFGFGLASERTFEFPITFYRK